MYAFVGQRHVFDIWIIWIPAFAGMTKK